MKDGIDQIKTLMRLRGYSIEKVASDIGVSWRTVYRWLMRETKPNQLGLRAIQEYLDKQAARPRG